MLVPRFAMGYGHCASERTRVANPKGERAGQGEQTCAANGSEQSVKLSNPNEPALLFAISRHVVMGVTAFCFVLLTTL